MNPRRLWRQQARASLETYFQQHSFPRLLLSLILAATGLVGFLISYGLLHSGVGSMSVRYPLAVIGAYAACLGLLRLWVELERRRFRVEHLPSADSASAPFATASRESWLERHGSWFKGLDSLDLTDDLEGCFVVVLALIVLGGIISVLVYLISGATVLLAEVFLDAFIVSALYRRLRLAAAQHWLGTALRRTGFQAILLATFLCLGGLLLEYLAPGAQSIGPALHQILHSGKSRSP